MNQPVYIYTDASFSKALEMGVAGWLVFRTREDHEARRLSSAMIRMVKFKETNNIRSEIRGVILALEEVRGESGKAINLYSDCRAITDLPGRREKLEACNFVSQATNKILSNADLYKKYFKLYDLLQPEVHWLKGHSPKAHRSLEQENFAFLDKAVRKELRS